MSEIQDKVLIIIQKAFKTTVVITNETQPSDIGGWDSIGHVMLIDRLEHEFEISFDIDELISMQTVGDIVKIIEQKRA